ncbi:hypothetical protein, partial [Salipiger thiooxidans]|uniref:hypothetical protein n=1 Tax=Salipiger thiooxidans TaxID=282683 RepID=UPI001CD3413D
SSIQNANIVGDLHNLNTQGHGILINMRAATGGDYSGWRVRHTGEANAGASAGWVLPFNSLPAGQVFNIGDTITGSKSSATATVLGIDRKFTSVGDHTYGVLFLGSLTGGPFEKGEPISNGTVSAVASTRSKSRGVYGICPTGTFGAPGTTRGGKMCFALFRDVPETFQPIVTDPENFGYTLLGFHAAHNEILYHKDAATKDLPLIELNGKTVTDLRIYAWNVYKRVFPVSNGGPQQLLFNWLSDEFSGCVFRDISRRQSGATVEAWGTEED